MSRKQAAKTRPGKAETERKRDERAARRAVARERRNRPQAEGDGGGTGGGLAAQLQALGLRLREVPGDGNCLFRALGDQLEGHSRNHLKHRQETVDYMIKQREDFEPFVEDDVPFEKHVANLAQPGTFAGNDAIVAFARNNQVNVVIHQLNAPLWQIRGTGKSDAQELHIAYRYGEHYDSVRKVNDNSEAPARLQTEVLSKNESNKKEKLQLKKEVEESEEEIRDEVEDAVQKVRNATGCLDADLIVQVLESESYSIDSAIFAILQMNEVKRLRDEEAQEVQANQQKSHPKPAQWEENGNGTGTSIFGPQGIENNNAPASLEEGNQSSKKQAPKISNKQKKEQQRLEKKRRQEDRHRQKVLASKGNNADNNRSRADSETQVTLVKTVAALNI